ncbi:MAG: hypothetical protein RL154_122, partial [Pseudomonadota bacterium]
MGFFRTNSIYANLVLLFSTFVLGFAVMIGVHLFLKYEISTLDEQLKNETARYRIGELIISHLDDIEHSFYKIASTTNQKAAKIIQNSVTQDIEQIEIALNTLEKGGLITHAIDLNLVGTEHLEENITYKPINIDRIVLEKIDIQPKLKEVEISLDAIAKLVLDRNLAIENRNMQAIGKTTDDIQSFLKKSDSMFIRMGENANRLLFDSKAELDSIKNTVEARKIHYEGLELLIIFIDLALVFLIGWVSARQIRETSKKLEDATIVSAQMALEAKNANEFKSEFLANMSHEIRTPLNAILGFIDIVLEKTTDAESIKHLKTVQTSGRTLLGIINDILDISKIESGKLEIETLDFSIKDELNEIASLFFEKAKEKSLNFNRSIDTSIPIALKGDPLRIRQVISNLLSNAIKFTNTGGTVSIEAHFDALANTIVVCVQDSGIGISDAHINNLFKSFSQEDSSITRKYGGTGLGLAISHKLVEMMGGELTVKSIKDEGSNFCFYIPYTEGDKTKTKAHIEAVKVPKKVKFSGKVLVVEDVKANQQLM